MTVLTLLLEVIHILCAVWVIYDVFTVKRKLSDGMKALWTVLAVLFSVITAIVYYLVYKMKK